MKNRYAKLFTLTVIAAFFLLGMSTAAMAAGTIKIGVAGPTSGDLASYGIPCTYAAKDFTEKINAKGGVLGKKIELMIEDDVCKPEVATNIAAKLISADVDFVMGHLCSSCTKAAMSIYKDSKVIAISGASTNDTLTLTGDYPNFYRTIAYDSLQAKLQVDYVTNALKSKSVAIIHDKGDYGKGQAELAKGFFEEAGKVEVKLFEGVTPGGVDYSAIVTKIKRAKVDSVVWGGYHPEASKIVMQMRKKRMTTNFMGADGVKDDTFIKVAGKYADGVYATGPIDTSQNPIAKDLITAHKKKYGQDVGTFYLPTYAGLMALANAIEKSGSTDYEAVSAALKSEQVETPLGKIGFDKNGDATGIGFRVYQVQKDKFVEVK
jgi:branched-chain amino acid transport system substrate-binding protein